MAKHVLWSEDEVIERVTTEFANGMAELDAVEDEMRKAMDALDRIVNT